MLVLFLMSNLKPIKNNLKKVEKGWGHELWIINNNLYCGKILHFNKNSKFSMHYHLQKDETWYVLSGEFTFRYIDGNNAEIKEKKLKKDESITIPKGLPHQLETIDGGEIMEVSTQHFENDSFRISKGDSQI